MNPWVAFVVAVLMIAGNGFFTAAEFALVAARRSKIEALAADGSRAAKTSQSLLRRLSLMLTGAQLGITLTSLVLGFVGEPLVSHLLEQLFGGFFGHNSAIAGTLSFAIALIVVTFFHMTFGEMVPKNIAIASPDSVLLRLAMPYRLVMLPLTPILVGLNGLANAGVRLFGIEPQDELEAVYSAEELSAVVGESTKHGAIEDVEGRLISGALDIGDTDAAEIMIPRTRLVAVPATASVAEIEAVVHRHGHSRIPVYDDDLDHLRGFVHAKDLLRVSAARRDDPLPDDLIRELFVVPETRKLLPLLVDMRAAQRHFALVVDEHGGTAGVVALEDVIEELVGELRDEYDDRSRRIRPAGIGAWMCDGATRVDEAAEEFGLRLPDGEYDTVSGFVLDRLGRIPTIGDAADHDGWRIAVTAMDGRRIATVRISRVSHADNADAAERDG